MSDAQVEFLTLDGQPCPKDQQPQRFTFRCVRYRGLSPKVTCGMLLIAGAGHGIKRDRQGQNGGSPQWDWDGNLEKPTFHPSINCERHCGWHGYVRNGRCVNVNGQDEP